MYQFAALSFAFALLAQANPIITVTTPAASAGPWYDTDYDRRIEIEVDHTKIDSTLSNYPLYVDASDLPASFFANLNPGLTDIRASADDHATGLHLEVVEIDTTAQTGEIYILVPTVSSTVGTVVYLYYDYYFANAYSTPEAVWADYESVYHFNESDGTSNQPNSAYASGTSAADLVPTSTLSSDAVAAKIGTGFRYRGSQYHSMSYPNSATYFDATTDYTLSLWFNAVNIASDDVLFANRMNSTSAGIGLWIWGATDLLRPSMGNNGTIWANMGVSPSSNTWHYTASGYDGTLAYVTLDEGTYSNTRSQTITGHGFGNTSVFVGKREDNSAYFTGDIDELRFRADAVGEDFLNAEYKNTNSPSTFYTVGTEETQ